LYVPFGFFETTTIAASMQFVECAAKRRDQWREAGAELQE
jgi:hypothetical protein